MKSEKEIREELQLHDMLDVFYAVFHGNRYLTYIGRNREEAIKIAEGWNDTVVAISDMSLLSYIQYTAVKNGTALILREGN